MMASTVTATSVVVLVLLLLATLPQQPAYVVAATAAAFGYKDNLHRPADRYNNCCRSRWFLQPRDDQRWYSSQRYNNRVGTTSAASRHYSIYSSSSSSSSNSETVSTVTSSIPMTVAGVSVSSTGFWVMLEQQSTATTTAPSMIQQPQQQKYYLPIQVTQTVTQTTTTSDDNNNDPPSMNNNNDDVIAATSPQALTLLQLLANVDMAGSILPPTILSEIVIVACEEESLLETSSFSVDTARTTTTTNQQQRQLALLDSVTKSIQSVWKSNNIQAPAAGVVPRYTEQTPWIRSRVRLPTCKLDQLVVVVASTTKEQQHPALGAETTTTQSRQPQFALHCTCSGYGPIVVPHLTDSMVHSVVDVEVDSTTTSTTVAFLALALALRYQAPIVYRCDNDAHRRMDSDDGVPVPDCFLSEDELIQQFPAYKGRAEAVLQPADRSASNIASSFEIHALQAALTMARKRGDMTAATKIRAAIDRLDEQSFQNLPVQAESDTSSMQ